jgi:hypothetical protein
LSRLAASAGGWVPNLVHAHRRAAQRATHIGGTFRPRDHIRSSDIARAQVAKLVVAAEIDQSGPLPP